MNLRLALFGGLLCVFCACKKEEFYVDLDYSRPAVLGAPLKVETPLFDGALYKYVDSKGNVSSLNHFTVENATIEAEGWHRVTVLKGTKIYKDSVLVTLEQGEAPCDPDENIMLTNKLEINDWSHVKVGVSLGFYQMLVYSVDGDIMTVNFDQAFKPNGDEVFITGIDYSNLSQNKCNVTISKRGNWSGWTNYQMADNQPVYFSQGSPSTLTFCNSRIEGYSNEYNFTTKIEF